MALILAGTVSYYRLVTTEDQRVVFKNKLYREIDSKITEWQNSGRETKLQDYLSEIGFKHLTASVYQAVRYFLMFVMLVLNVVVPYFVNGLVDQLAIAIIIVVYIATEPKLKFSATSYVLKMLIERKHKNKVREVFTLFDILKAELKSMNANQDINVYNLIRDVSPSLNHIQGTLARFLSLWKRAPEQAKDVFEKEIGGESAKVLGSVLFKLDSVSREQALKLIEDESSVFTFNFYQKEIQKSTGLSNVYFAFFMGVNIFILVWLIYFIYIMFNERMSNTNLGVF